MNNEVENHIYIVDDDQSVRESLRYMLEGYGFNVLDFTSGDDFIDAVDTNMNPGCLILDSKMPGISGQEVHDKLNRLGSTFSVIFLTGHGDTPMAVKAFRNGASDFFQKPVTAAELVPSIEKALKTSHLRYQKYFNETLFQTLSEREKKLFQLVTKGLINKQIAEQLNISLRTVEVHRAKMMQKLNIENITDLVKFFDVLKSEI